MGNTGLLFWQATGAWRWGFYGGWAKPFRKFSITINLPNSNIPDPIIRMSQLPSVSKRNLIKQIRINGVTIILWRAGIILNLISQLPRPFTTDTGSIGIHRLVALGIFRLNWCQYQQFFVIYASKWQFFLLIYRLWQYKGTWLNLFHKRKTFTSWDC